MRQHPMTRRIALLAAVLIAGLIVVLGRGEERVEARDKVPPLATIAAPRRGAAGAEVQGAAQGPQGHREGSCSASRTASWTASAPSSAGARAREQDLLKLLGFESRRARPSDLGNTTGILGVYDPPSKTLTIVTDAQGSRAQKELTYAHELTHALEDQHFGGLPSINGGGDDASIARRALVEGSARFTEVAYAREHLGANVTRKDLASRVPASTVRGQINYFLNADRFAYLDGSRYVAQLVREGGQDARDAAFRQPPKATADILHPTPGLRRPRAGASSTSAASPRASSASRAARWASSTPASCSSSARSSGTAPGARRPPAPRAWRRPLRAVARGLQGHRRLLAAVRGARPARHPLALREPRPGRAVRRRAARLPRALPEARARRPSGAAGRSARAGSGS